MCVVVHSDIHTKIMHTIELVHVLLHGLHGVLHTWNKFWFHFFQFSTTNVLFELAVRGIE